MRVRRPIEGAADAYFTRRMFLRQYFPALASAAALTVADMADAIVVGNRMGAVGLAALSFALPIFMIYNVIMHSLGMGGSILYASLMAKGEEERARSLFQGVMAVLVALGLIIAVGDNLALRPILVVLGADPANQVLFSTTAVYVRLLLGAAPFFFLAYGLGYFLRNDDLERQASLSASAGNILDVVLNVVLVLFLHMGAAGAGLATLTGVDFTTALDLFFLLRKGTSLKLFPAKPKLREVPQCFRDGFSSCVSYVYLMLFLLIGNNAMMRLAGEEGVAVFDVIQNIGYLFSYLYGAVTQAAQPVLSTYQGERNFAGCRSLQRYGAMIGISVGIAAAALMALLAPQVCALFGLTPDSGGELGAWAVRIFCLGTLFLGPNLLAGGFCLARGAAFPSFLVSTLRGAAVLLPATLACIALGPRGFWALYPITEGVTALLFFLYLRFLYREKRDLEEARIYRAVIRNDTAELGRATQEIEEFCERWEASMKQQYFVQMTVEEICGAIIAKGFQGGEDDMIQITLAAEDNGLFTLNLRDSAVRFNPFEMARTADGDPDPDFNAVGMQVIKTKAISFYYRRYQGFNTMVVKI